VRSATTWPLPAVAPGRRQGRGLDRPGRRSQRLIAAESHRSCARHRHQRRTDDAAGAGSGSLCRAVWLSDAAFGAKSWLKLQRCRRCRAGPIRARRCRAGPGAGHVGGAPPKQSCKRAIAAGTSTPQRPEPSIRAPPPPTPSPKQQHLGGRTRFIKQARCERPAWLDSLLHTAFK